MLAEWPVVLVSKRSEIPFSGDPIPGGDTTYATFVTLNGQKTAIVVCPRCGEERYCPGHGSSVSRDGLLTIHPSLNCDCVGHYLLTDGVIREV